MTALASWAPPSAAVVPHDGSGFALADDETNWSDLSSFPNLGDGFVRLRPRLFRLQTVWNTVDKPEWLARAHGMIAAARAQGVHSIVVSLRSNNPGNVGPEGYFPTPAEYEAKVGALVLLLAGQVDVWGPANEPNGSWRSRDAPGGAAPLDPATLAGYQLALERVTAAYDPTALTTSPDFLDRRDLGSLEGYLSAYVRAGGGWGDVVAWHPYNGVAHATLSTTDDLTRLIPPSHDIWVTEIGAHHGEDARRQDTGVRWIVGELADHPRVTRLFYYHLRENNPRWDTALLDADGTPRPAWRTWCRAVHGGDGADPDCATYSRAVVNHLLSVTALAAEGAARTAAPVAPPPDL